MKFLVVSFILIDVGIHMIVHMEVVLDKYQVAYKHGHNIWIFPVELFICREYNKENDEHQVCKMVDIIHSKQKEH